MIHQHKRGDEDAGEENLPCWYPLFLSLQFTLASTRNASIDLRLTASYFFSLVRSAEKTGRH